MMRMIQGDVGMEAKKRAYSKPAIRQCLPDTAEYDRWIDALGDEPECPVPDDTAENNEATEDPSLLLS